MTNEFCNATQVCSSNNADYENYLRHELSEWGAEILFSSRMLERGLFNVDVVRNLWEQHQRGDRLWTIGKVAPLMTLELVLRHLLDDDSPDHHPFSRSGATLRSAASLL